MKNTCGNCNYISWEDGDYICNRIRPIDEHKELQPDGWFMIVDTTRKACEFWQKVIPV